MKKPSIFFEANFLEPYLVLKMALKVNYDLRFGIYDLW